jgi:Protein of unknown function (DUF5818)
MRIFSLTALMVFSVTAASIPYSAPETYSFQTQERPEIKTVIGMILKSGDKFVLSDTATKSKYFLDDQDKARRFEGKHVKVTGRIDAAKNLIHVTSIQEIV